jgi:nucleotide-binding universal stress UspA family protein
VIRSILVALDESWRAPSVFRAATSLARQFAAEVFIIRVLWIPPDIPPAAHVRPDGVEGRMEQTARNELRQLMTTVPELTFGPPIVVEGEPWRQILRVSEELAVDLIVLGNHGSHGLERVLGTVAAKVVNHAHRDVFIVHSNHEQT